MITQDNRMKKPTKINTISTKEYNNSQDIVMLHLVGQRCTNLLRAMLSDVKTKRTLQVQTTNLFTKEKSILHMTLLQKKLALQKILRQHNKARNLEEMWQILN